VLVRQHVPLHLGNYIPQLAEQIVLTGHLLHRPKELMMMMIFSLLGHELEL
jgi:hypothetical protein